MGAGGGRGDQDLKGSRLLSGLTVGAWHYTLVQTHRASNPKSDPTVNHGLCVMTMCQSGGHPSGGGGGGVDRGEAVPVRIKNILLLLLLLLSRFSRVRLCATP